MILINESVLNEARNRDFCEICGKKAGGVLDAMHIMSRGAGRVDIPGNILGGHRLCHTKQDHSNGMPPAAMLKVAAKREGMTPDAIQELVWLVRRYDRRKAFSVPEDGDVCDECFLPDFICACDGRTLYGNYRTDNMKEHKWRLVIQRGDECDTVDTIQWCENCGAVRHDYSYDNGKKSPNYPVFFIPGIGKTPNSQECVEV